MTFDLNRHVARLLMNEPFFAALSRRIDKRPSTSFATAGVRVDPESGYFEMVYNPEFFEKLSEEHQAGVLKHEFYHLVFEHVTGRQPDGVSAKLWNIAADLAINSHLEGELPETCLMPGRGEFEELPIGKSAEWYLSAIKNTHGQGDGESKAGQGKKGSGKDDKGSGDGDDNHPGQFDDHSGWGNVDNTTNEIAKERLKDSIKKAAEEATRASNWGTVSRKCRKEIMDRIATKVDWRKVLRYFVKTSQRASKSSTIKRINRRYAYIHPGRKVQRQARIAISVDQSGSVSDAMLNAFFNELNTLAELAEFTVIPFDTDVAEDKVYTWKKNEKRKWQRVLSGGTDFNPPTEYVNKNNFDGHIVLTDLYAPKPKASKCQRMWMTTKEYAARPYFQTNEKIIAIDIN